MSRFHEIKNEIARVQVALANTKSECLKRDYSKYLIKLQRELKRWQSAGCSQKQ